MPSTIKSITKNSNTELKKFDNAFIGFTNYARSEAIVRNQQVIICAKSNGSNACEASSEWTKFETQMFVDVDGSDDWSAGDILLKTLPAIDTSETQTKFTRQTASQKIKFQSGGLSSINHKFDINAVSTDAAYETKYGRTICISKPGRARVTPLTSAACSAF